MSLLLHQSLNAGLLFSHCHFPNKNMDSFDTDMNQSFEIHSTPSPSPSPTSLNPTWESRYEELLQWRAEKGDTCVPKAEGALGRWVARQRELKRTGKLDPTREDALNSINFVWNTVTAMWEERFRRLSEWKGIHGHCAVPIAQGELGTWVSKQRQLRKRGKLSKEKIDALDNLNFTWSTAEADWEDKFKRLCEWTRERGHASVPFNEGELGWWVNTQRQCKRKGKLSSSREARLQSLGFVWNPSNSRSRTTNTTTTNPIKALSSVGTTPTSTPEKSEKMETEQDTTSAILQLFATEDTPEMIEMKQEHDVLDDNPSPVSAVAGHLPIRITPPPPSSEPLMSPSPAFLSQNLWSPTVLSSPLLNSGFSSFNIPNSIHEPSGGSQIPIVESTSQSHSDILDTLFTRDDGYVLDQANVDSLLCYEEL